MNQERVPEVEDLIRAEVDRAVAPYVGKAPPVMLRKLRELAERYWRERPEAVRALRLKNQSQRVRSGMDALAPDADVSRATGTEKE
jgi:hypothetical protein